MLTLSRLALVALCVALLGACAAVTGTGDPNVAATVNGTEIPVSEVEERFEQAKSQPQVAQQLEADTTGAAESQLQAEILSQMIASELLVQWADELGVEATDEEVAEETEALVEQLGGQEAFDQAVAESGLSEDEVTFQIRQRVLQKEISEEVASDVEVSDEDIAAFYEQNGDRFGATAKARHILVEEKSKAQSIMAELRSGKGDFAKLAEKESADPGSAAQGGELGEFGRGQMVPEFEEAVFNAEEGDLVGPVKSQFGFHIIEVLELSEGPSLEESSEEIRSELAESQQGELLQTRLKERTEEAEVTVNPRFGTWSSEEARVQPTNPLGDASETGGGTEGPGAATGAPMAPSEAATE